MSQGVWLITGAQASGKSTVADLLARRFDRGVHVRGGQFYRWAVRGWAHFDDSEHPEEARRLLQLRYRLSALVAREYALAGFTTVVQDNIYGRDVVDWIGFTDLAPTYLVVLRPSVEVVARRHEQRRRQTGKIAFRGSYTVAANDADLATTPQQMGLWLDTSHQTPDETVETIVRRAVDARVS
jgi:chloramphenicol 3-O-phosphotransferase